MIYVGRAGDGFAPLACLSLPDIIADLEQAMA